MTMGVRSETLKPGIHTALSLALLGFVTFTVVLLNLLGVSGGVGFGLILSITGGIGGSLSSFIIPALLYIKISSPENQWYYPAWVLFFLGWIVLFAVVIVTILGLA